MPLPLALFALSLSLLPRETSRVTSSMNQNAENRAGGRGGARGFLAKLAKLGENRLLGQRDHWLQAASALRIHSPDLNRLAILLSRLEEIRKGFYHTPTKLSSAPSAEKWAPSRPGELPSLDNINPRVVKAEYAVRGEIVLRASEYQKRLAEGDKSLPFDEVIPCNVGNPQALGQKPITYFREVLSLVSHPKLLESREVTTLFSKDSVRAAKEYLSLLPGGSSGAYSNSMGLLGIRKKVAKFLERRDGYSADPGRIFLTNGASAAVQMAVQLLIGGPSDGILVPIPQYPLYSASIALYGGTQVNYTLAENKGWGTSIEDVQRAYDEATAKGIKVKGIVVINPGNPTGQCLEEKNMREIIEFCAQTGTVLLADEVYQTNIYSSTPFVSFKKALRDVEHELERKVPLISFHSVSKGFVGECGRRGGYMEVVNFDEKIRLQLYKLASVILSPNVDGQIMTGLMVDPPLPNSESYDEYSMEGAKILTSLSERARVLVKALNGLEGVHCNPVEGALYAFPRIKLPPGAIAAAKKKGKNPDAFYCLELLDSTGIVVVPGSGFGQEEGTFHFRTSIIPPLDKIAVVSEKIRVFHEKFMQKYGGIRSL
uniref:Aminotransferase class I/classII large domain-containing protein n=1 Tax=Amorphochlora amoebiformis TaxID=1561963 RepID=A0A7S0H5X6_9EUKA|mmetsp:Transcript_32066/g.51638  ORF Transcript_32066/g.51638 Transcript_32066/m.51638 type:complete len:600 (+) Transcript_32066:62-1861(+)